MNALFLKIRCTLHRRRRDPRGPSAEHRSRSRSHGSRSGDVGLGQFETDIAAAEHHQMRGRIVEVERASISGQRPRDFGAWNARIAACVPRLRKTWSPARTRVTPSFSRIERFRRDKPPAAHDQFGAACFVVMQKCIWISRLTMSRFRWRTFAMSVVGRPGDHRYAELSGVLRQMRDPRTPNLVLAGQAGNVGTGTDPPALDDGSPRRPDCARCQASSLPPNPLPRIKALNCSD